VITVLGAGGFIGSHLVRRLGALGLDHRAPRREEDLRGRDLGVVVDCAGVTDFRERPLDAVEGHVCRLERLLRESRFESLTYLSTLAVYRRVGAPAHEDDPLALVPDSDLYAISKAMGESLVLSCHPRGRVVRLASVYGADLRSGVFLSSVLRDVVTKGEVTLGTALESSRDYVSVHDVVDCLIDIAPAGRHRVYNVASGRTVSNGQLAARLAETSGCQVAVAPGAPILSYPRMDIERVREEFGFEPSHLLDDLPGLLDEYRDGLTRAESAPPAK
jgi:nucleoside-diphosphate-sugar epimerase